MQGQRFARQQTSKRTKVAFRADDIEKTSRQGPREHLRDGLALHRLRISQRNEVFLRPNHICRNDPHINSWQTPRAEARKGMARP
jgi:hypothetical protein